MSTLPPSRQELTRRLNRAVQRMGNITVLFTHAIASHIGLSATEFECYSVLIDEGPVAAGRLAELTGLTTGAITGLVDRLERAGYVRRLPDIKDRRRVIIEPVVDPAVVAKIEALYRPVSAAFDAIVTHYTDAELALVERFITESMESVEPIKNQLRSDSKRNP